MPFRFALLAVLVAGTLVGTAIAQPKPKEQCATRGGQYAEAEYCVSSALPAEGDRKFGPEVLAEGDEKRAWCEGATGYGIGETITIRLKPPVRLQELTFVNGFPMSEETFRNNSRVKQLRIQTSDGLATVVTLPDKAEPHTIKLPRPVKPQWVRFSIVDVYPGAKGSDTCLAGIQPNLEQLNR